MTHKLPALEQFSIVRLDSVAENRVVRRIVPLAFPATAALLLLPRHSPGANSTRPAVQAFETYITALEARLPRQPRPEPPLPGTLRIEPVNGGTWAVTGGLLHHWRGAALLPNATPRQMLALLRDYDHLPGYYAPEIVSSHAVTNSGPAATIVIRFRKRKVITVVLDAEFDVHNGLTSDTRGYSISRSTHIWQVDQPGTPREHRRMEGQDDGLLWRLNSYWNFFQLPGGLLIECEAVSLTRDVPRGLGWLIQPVIQNLPRESLEFTLQATRKALSKGLEEPYK